MKPIITLTLLFLTLSCFAQKENVYFLKNDGRYLPNKDSADYTRVVQEPDSGSTLYKVFEYYPDNKPKSAGLSLKVDPPRYQGTLISYYKNGKKQAVNNLINNQFVGEQFDYYPNGKIYRVTKYADSADKTVASSLTAHYLITAEYDSTGTQIITNGNGYYKGYDSKFKIIDDEGPLINGERNGVWKGRDADTHITFTETYENGELMKGVSYAPSGDSAIYNKTRYTFATFKGGLPAFYHYVGRSVEYPSYERSHNIQGRVILSFVIEKDGKTSNIKVLSSVSDNIDAEAVRVIKESPLWIPATSYGRKVRSYYKIPLNFALTGN